MEEDASRPRILFVDDEPAVLAAMGRTLHAEPFDLYAAPSAAVALEILRRDGPFAVIVSDLRMPETDGVTLLEAARELAPDTVRILFTGQPDVDTAIGAVNKGAIFRFLVKPCPRSLMAFTLGAALDQHRLLTAERVLLEQTLHGSIKALTDVLALASPLAFGRATRLWESTGELVTAMGIRDKWHVEVATMLSQIGCVTLPPGTLERLYRSEPLSENEQAMVERLPAVVEQLLVNIPRLEPVREILRYRDKRFNGSGPPPGTTAGENIPWGARALKIIVDLDILESQGIPLTLSFDTLRGRRGWYDPAILEALATIRKSAPRNEVRELPLRRLLPGMVLAQDLKTDRGLLLVTRGQEVTPSLLEKLQNFSTTLFGPDCIRVIIRDLTKPVRYASLGALVDIQEFVRIQQHAADTHKWE